MGPTTASTSRAARRGMARRLIRLVPSEPVLSAVAAAFLARPWLAEALQVRRDVTQLARWDRRPL
jgi:hypothetical protein